MLRQMFSATMLYAALFYTSCSTGTESAHAITQSQDQTPQQIARQPDLDDGPYAFFHADQQQLEVKWLCQQQLIEKTQLIEDAIAPVCGYPRAIQVRPQQHLPEPSLRYSTDKLAVISDIHGQQHIMVGLLKANAVVDTALNWSFGNGHLVVVGDVMDRGDKVTEILWWLYQLEQQAQAAGGKVHLLLGNHETMVLYNDLRYINSKYQQVATRLGTDYSGLFSENSVLGQWLRSRPVLAQVNDMLFVHGGLHPDYLALGMSVAEVNEQFRQSLGIARDQLKGVPVLNFLYGSLGPLWYRGYFRQENAITEPLLQQLLSTLNVQRIVVGHTSMDGVYSHYAGRVISVDSNIKQGESGEILLWQNGELRRGTLSGQQLPMRTLAEQSSKAD
ncbi:MAG: metallophosphoesterase [Gammaproteobacteria bacterium]|nr:metallophosphoesterase [Gammaproteobacteria bacterium]MBU1556345.1 metallophosphoesterase [Gammaproteobacteria bacterium]MBU2069414.1 metallophosphoesterase [Gammaproteobacteria bacterium]MBU2182919.1 metallophosphoesterase [Gammaproteobacteria bacterium]MBU2203267.1 metallophosphoesterase [Gammaproteobacteria bacterium]